MHKKDMLLNKKKLKELLDSKGMSYKELWLKVTDVYGLDLSYKGFMSLLSNRNTWKLLFAYAITDVLNTNIPNIFDVVDVNIEEKMKEKEKWKKKYQK